jgi:hypothetical protein
MARVISVICPVAAGGDSPPPPTSSHAATIPATPITADATMTTIRYAGFT